MNFTEYQDENCYSRYSSQPSLRSPRQPLSELGTNILGAKNISSGSLSLDHSSSADLAVPKKEVCGVSLWSEETVRSHDSGVGGLEDVAQARARGLEEEDDQRNDLITDQTPDLLDCLMLEDFEERVRQIRCGGAKPSEMICLNNLMKQLNIQQLESTSARMRRPVTEDLAPGGGLRAIIGAGSRRRDHHGSGSENYFQDMQSLTSLMEQEVPLAFPGQTTSSPPVNIKHSPAHHPPAVNVAQVQVVSDNIINDLQVFNTVTNDLQAYNNITNDLHVSRRVNNVPEPGSRARIHPQFAVKGRQDTNNNYNRSITRRNKDVLMLKDLRERVGEARYQLNALINERRSVEESFNMSSGTRDDELVEQDVHVEAHGRRSRHYQELLSFLKDLRREETNLKRLLNKTSKVVPYKRRVMVKSLLDVVNSWSSSAAQLLSLVGNSSSVGESGMYRDLDQGVMQINKGTRRIRTMMWTIHNHNNSTNND